jgi:uncharacterized protein
MSYTQTVKSVTISTNALINILKKLPEFMDSHKGMNGNHLISENYILSCRIAPNMFPLSKQVQIVSDNLKGMVARISGVEAPKMEDNETTVAQLIERLEKTLEFVHSIDESKYERADDRKATLPFMPTKYMDMSVYVHSFAIPNIHFHITTTYNILRSLGLDIGKRDFIGNIEMKDL